MQTDNHRNWILAVATTIMLLLSACRAEPDRTATITRDSMGIEIVESPTLLPLDDPSRQWTLTLVREIATAGPDLAAEPRIWDPEDVARTASGDLVVADRGPHRLLVVAADSVIARFGTRGGGPGEISADGGGLAIRPMPDGTITVVELWGNTRIHRFSESGHLINDTEVENFFPWWSIGRSPAEITVQVATPGEHEGMPFGQHIARLDLRTGKIESFAPLPETVDPVPGGRPLFYPIRFWTALSSGSVVTMRTDSAQIAVYTADGQLRRHIRLPLTPSPMTPEIEARLAAGFRQLAGRSYAATRRLVRKLVTVEDTLFALEHTWLTRPVEDADPGDDVVLWRMMSESGRQKGIVRFPRSFNPWYAAEGYVIGVSRDSLDVATIQEYRLAPPAAR